ncbi:MAG: 5-formyltetrahydrofolate cyclo-ligase [Lachnospiraceae bacterium]
MTITNNKKQLRQELIKQRGLLPDAYCKAADQAIAAHILELEAYQRANTIFCFVSTAEEITTLPVFEHAWANKKRTGVPLCTGKGVMEVREIKSMNDLLPGHYGIQEPSPEAPIIRPEEIDFVLVPCLSCSPDGRRLGYGGGFYDRYLSQVNAVKAVICRAKLIRIDIPIQPHDIYMDLVITEKGTHNDTKHHSGISITTP